MSQRIIRKVLVELEKDKPDISYVRGLLEGIIEDGGVSVSTPRGIDPSLKRTGPSLDHVDEEIIPEIAKPGPIGKLG